jgi:hypothetical protein
VPSWQLLVVGLIPVANRYVGFWTVPGADPLILRDGQPCNSVTQ